MMENQEEPRDYAIFASFKDRFIAFSLDLIVLYFALVVFGLSLQKIVSRDSLWDSLWIPVGLVLVYLTSLTASPVRATLGKLMQGLRVVDYNGNSLNLWRAALRSIIAGGLPVAALTIVNCPTNARLYPVAIGSILLVLLPALTPRRQGVQDVVAGSIVVRKDALQRPDAHELIRYVVGRGAGRPPAFNILGNVLLVSLPAFLLFLGADVAHQKNLRARVAYAIDETSNLRALIADYYTLEGSFPTNAVSLGVAVDTPHPDGGYYHLEQDGAIRIGFTVLPALKSGSILLQPSTDTNGAVQWECTVHGNLAPGYVPAACRE